MGNNWISVKDRLPEYGTDVLWYFSNNQYMIGMLLKDDDNQPILGGYYNGTVYSPATHWQLLEPPLQNKLK